jgi:hypothetical protein
LKVEINFDRNSDRNSDEINIGGNPKSSGAGRPETHQAAQGKEIDAAVAPAPLPPWFLYSKKLKKEFILMRLQLRNKAGHE